MKKIILSVIASVSLLGSVGGAQGLKTMVYKNNSVIQMKYVLTCGTGNLTCEKVCQNATQCEISEAQSCFNCYRDSDLTLRSLFNQPQTRYASGPYIFNSDATAEIFRDPSVFVVGIRQNILLDPMKADSFTQLQSVWNAMCPVSSVSSDAIFLIKQTEAGYKPFALMCGEQLHLLQYEASYGRGSVVPQSLEKLIRMGEVK